MCSARLALTRTAMPAERRSAVVSRTGSCGAGREGGGCDLDVTSAADMTLKNSKRVCIGMCSNLVVDDARCVTAGGGSSLRAAAGSARWLVGAGDNCPVHVQAHTHAVACVRVTLQAFDVMLRLSASERGPFAGRPQLSCSAVWWSSLVSSTLDLAKKKATRWVASRDRLLCALFSAHQPFGEGHVIRGRIGQAKPLRLRRLEANKLASPSRGQHSRCGQAQPKGVKAHGRILSVCVALMTIEPP